MREVVINMIDELDKKYAENLKRFQFKSVKESYKKFSYSKSNACVTDFTLHKWGTGKSSPTQMNKELVIEFFKSFEGGK